MTERLKLTPCPHCQVVGSLIRHGFLYGFDDTSPRRKTVRARRLFCSNRQARPGCGRTVSVWCADKIRRLSLTTACLWRFLQLAVAGSLRAAIRAAAATSVTGPGSASGNASTGAKPSSAPPCRHAARRPPCRPGAASTRAPPGGARPGPSPGRLPGRRLSDRRLSACPAHLLRVRPVLPPPTRATHPGQADLPAPGTRPRGSAARRPVLRSVTELLSARPGRLP